MKIFLLALIFSLGVRAEASPVFPQDPEYVRLSDGRLVKFGPGVICDERCAEAVAPVDDNRRRSVIILTAVAFTGLTLLLLPRCPPVTPSVPAPPFSPPPGPPITPIPETGTGALLALGLLAGLIFSARKVLWKKEIGRFLQRPARGR